MDELKQSLITNLFSAYLTGKENGGTRTFHDWERENRVTELILKDISSLLKKELKEARINELAKLGGVAFRDERYKQSNSTQIVLFGHILNNIKEIEDEKV